MRVSAARSGLVSLKKLPPRNDEFSLRENFGASWAVFSLRVGAQSNECRRLARCL